MRRLVGLLICLAARGGPPGFREILAPGSSLSQAQKRKAFDGLAAKDLGSAIKQFAGFESTLDLLQKEVIQAYAIYAKAGAAYWGWRQKTGGAAEEVPQAINRAYIDSETAAKKALAVKRRQRLFHAWIEKRAAELVAQQPKAVRAAISGLRHRSAYQRLRCLGILRAAKDPGTAPALVKRARLERNPVVAGALFEALRGHAAGLQHPAWQARAGAIRGFETRRSRCSVERLLGRMQEETGVLLDDFGHALRRLTGQTLGSDAGAWRQWWDKLGPDWKPPRERPVEFDRAKSPGVGGDGPVRWFSIHTSSRSIVYCFDAPAFAGREAARSIATLPEEAQFGIVIAGGQVRRWKPKLMPARAAQKKAAAEFLREAKSDHKSDLYRALIQALDLEPDTIFLFTARGPGSTPFGTQLMFTDPMQVAQEVMAHNRVRGVRIHAVGPSGARNGFWLQRLARQFGGTFIGQ